MIIDIINKRSEKAITLEANVFNSGILITNFSQGNIPGTFNKIKGINQHGSSLLSTKIEEREMFIEAIILAEDRRGIDIIKIGIDEVINPLDKLLIKYSDGDIKKEIIASADATPNYSTNYKTNNENCLAFKVSFECFNPFWMDQEETIMQIETWEGGFEFEFELISTGIEFARKGPNELNIINNGNIDAPLEIYFKGPALNPCVALGDGRFIKVNKDLNEEETLYIRTSFGNKAVKVIKDGVENQAYHYIDIDSSFFDLAYGENILSYSTEGDFIPQSVIIKYKCHYFSL